MKTKLILAIGVLILGGCGMLGSQGVPKEQIDADIATKTVKVEKPGSEWIFSGDSQRCFAVVDNETKYTSSNAEVVVNVSSWRDKSIGSSLYYTVSGKMLMTYKKDGDKWILEKIESKDFIEKPLQLAEFKTFLDIHTPLCKYYRFVK